MKIAATLSVAVSLFAGAQAMFTPAGDQKINDLDKIAALNKVEGSTWTAGVNENFGERTYDEVRAFVAGTALGNHISDFMDHTLPQSHYDAMNTTIPDEFDGRTAFPGLLRPIRNQEHADLAGHFLLQKFSLIALLFKQKTRISLLSVQKTWSAVTKVITVAEVDCSQMHGDTSLELES